ncbi:unnamed protein product [Adineta ricciae]|uniref:Uncharacterized protein n=2 Tax=Adineta ricciae TaxID=249248 RepID=A0A815LXR8_ADIRI|nr:unnamed protein product [Adineta ricciae]
MKESDTSPLTVIVSGGGPVGLTFSLNLVMMMGKRVKIIIYEGRWFVDENSLIRWQGEEQGKMRRDQVVTLQDHVIEQMPVYVQKGLFQNIDERVWPTSRNIPIREVEDRLFDLIQPFVQAGQVELIPESLHEQTERLVKGDFDLLIGTDGSNSFVRRYCNIPMVSEGVEYACGVAYNIPTEVPSSEEPLHQALNCILTVAQTRYLVNSSSSRRGYLNIRLIKSEYDELRGYLQEFQNENKLINLSDVNQCPNSSIVWSIIRQGLEFFKIHSKYVVRVAPIEINVRHAAIVVRELRFELKEDVHEETKKYKTVLACLAGDAALNVHFWPGRGMNSGMKAAMALARNILRCCPNETVDIRRPLRFLDFLDYEGFMARLRAREQQGRSLRVLIDPIDQSVVESYSYVAMSHCHIRYRKRLIEKLQDMRQRLTERPDWPHTNRPITDEELGYAPNRINPNAIAQLSLANPWPTREMSGADVLVEGTYPFEQQNFLAVPRLNHKSLSSKPSVLFRQRFVSLWIVNESNDDIIKNLPKVSSTETRVVRTIDAAKKWMVKNRESMHERGNLFKVVIIWSEINQLIAIDFITTIRTQEAHTPILFFTNKRDEIQSALEFPNVTATDTLFDLYEFVGINQEAQWNSGCRASHVQLRSESMNSPVVFRKNISVSYSKQPKGNLLFIWIGTDDHHPTTVEQLLLMYPQLEIQFTETFNETRTYLNQNIDKIKQRQKVLVICSGRFSKESKNITDVMRLFYTVNFNVSIVVDTQDRAQLRQKLPSNIPKYVQIFDEQEHMLLFIANELSNCF